MKRSRTAFSAEQLLQLDDAFKANQYLIGQERRQLASSLGLTETQVQYRPPGGVFDWTGHQGGVFDRCSCTSQ